MSLSLLQQQQYFAHTVGEFLCWIYQQGYQVTFSEAYRSPQEAAINARTGAGIAHSLHCERLAIDLNLFRAGKLLTSVEDYRPLGEHWESIDTLCCWGGRFSRPDADHFSMTWGDIK